MLWISYPKTKISGGFDKGLSYYFSFSLWKDDLVLVHFYLWQSQLLQAVGFSHNAGVVNTIIVGVALSHSMFLLGLLFKIQMFSSIVECYLFEDSAYL